MSYYKDLQRAYQWLETQTEAAKRANVDIEEDFLVYECTKQFPVGEKPIRKRIQDIKRFEVKQ